MKLKSVLMAALISLSFLPTKADEGMWLPLLLGELNEAEMQAMGMRITAQDIYDANNSSIKDAIVHFGGFCTGEMISPEGLLLTNHHCGYGAIQSHSSVENDYLTDGYWAKNKGQELPNEGLYAMFIKYIVDVTDEVLQELPAGVSEEDREKLIQKIGEGFVEQETEGTHYGGYVRSFFNGNQFFMFITETFPDVRLVGAPPSSIGKYGADTDNWMWPRHTGDFSLFRVYMGPDGLPAEYSEDNVPYRPKHHLPISLKGYEPGDFSMVFGFPGRTQEYLPSVAIEQLTAEVNPARIELREEALAIMDKYMRADDEIRIQYASSFASIANYWKKWIGENTGLRESRAIERKRNAEADFRQKVSEMKNFKDEANIFAEYEKLYNKQLPYALARNYYVELGFRMLKTPGYALDWADVVNAKSGEDRDEAIAKLKADLDAHFKNYSELVEHDLWEKLVPFYASQVNDTYLAESLVALKGENMDAKISSMFYDSYITQPQKLKELLEGSPKKVAKKISKDPIYQLSMDMYSAYRSKVYGEYYGIEAELDLLHRRYMKALMAAFPDSTFYPDANSTLRVTYGQVKGFAPKDAVSYQHYTTMDGLVAKYVPGDYEFDLPKRMLELANERNYGQYANENGELPICFIAANHTTGGNSGSPALDADGNLIGLNFDRAWEGTMSDINYDVRRCRNIMVDARYILWTVDVFAGAGYLLDEMTLVRKPVEEPEEAVAE